jgi:lipopolysaccharide transport system permease protein
MRVAYEGLHVESATGAHGLRLRFRLVNRGGETWRRDDQFCLGWQLYDPATGLFLAEGEWSALDADIAPGQGSEIGLDIELPAEPGGYDVYVSPRSESKGWFFEEEWPFVLIRAASTDRGVELRDWRITTKGRLWRERFPGRLKMALALPWSAILVNGSLIRSMSRRDLAVRYRGSAFDVVWTILHPLLLMLTYFFVFGIVLQARFGADPSRSGFVLYFLAGMLPWLPFSEAVGRSPVVVLEHRNLVKKVVFPVEILPVNLVVSSLATQAFALAIFLVLLLVTRGTFPATIAWLPVLLIPQTLLTLGLCWLLAASGVFLRDLSQMIGFALTLCFFLTPICYPEASLPAAAIPILEKNPMFALVRGYRAIFLEAAPPAFRSTLALWLGSWVVFTLGYAWFHRLRRSFPDVV